MIDSFALLYALLVAIVVLIIFAIKRIAKVRVWIHTRMSSKDSLREIAYLELDDTQTAGEIHLVGASNVPPVGRVIVDNDSKISRGFVELLTSDLNDDSVKPRYRNIGYIGFDATDISVDEYGFIYKQIKGKKQKEVVGYTARPSKPNTPTIYGERSWKTLWLKCTLCAYVGEPHPELDEKPRKKADKEVVVSTTDNSLSPVVESLCINAKKVCKINVVLNDIKDVESNDVVDESNVENEPLSIDSNEVIQSLVLDDVATSNMENKYESNVEIQEELIGGSDKNLEVEEGIENDFNVDLIEDNAPLESSIEEENTEVVSEKELVLVLSDEEKARLDKLKLNNPQLISTIVKNMVKIEGGEFVMGSDSASENNDSLDLYVAPAHKVKLQTYYILKYPITQLEWTLIMGDNISDCKENDKYPVAPVNWNQTQEFLLRLSYLTGTSFMLPTEAQWEYAARGGKYSKGYIYSGSDNFSEVGWSDYKHVVGEKKPNELGIYDMSGLVREWCSDFWGRYSEVDQVDPIGPDKSSSLILLSPEGELCHVVRSLSGNEKVISRKGETSDLKKEFKSYGFRCVCIQLPQLENEVTENSSTVVHPLEEPTSPILMAKCSFVGLHSSRKDYLPAEARACAYAMLYRFAPYKNKYVEYYKEKPYGWRDTALLTSLIYTLLYVLLYTVNTGVFQMPLLEHNIPSTIILVLFYYVLWAIVRAVKIELMENSPAFQYKLDLFNKNLGISFLNILILFMASVAIVFTFFYYDYDFAPLIWAIMFGVSVNMFQQKANKRWIVKSDFNETEDVDEENDDDAEMKNPDGDIARSYEWDLDSSNYGKGEIHGSLTLYFRATEIVAMRHCNPFFSQRKDLLDKDCILNMFYFLKEHKAFLDRVKYIVYNIKKIASKYSLSKLDTIQFVLDFVQEPNIAFQINKESKTLNYYDAYIRFPDETLYDKTGDCNSKSLLAAMLFHIMGYDVLYLFSRSRQHAAVGLKVDVFNLKGVNKENLVEYCGNYYVYCETTGDKFVVGDIAGMSLDDFDEKVLLPLSDENTELEDESDDSVSRIFVWDLDSALGNNLKGTMVLNFEPKSIGKLREINPFRTYGRDGRVYQDNVSSMFSYLKLSPSRMHFVQLIADYIRESVKTANLPEIDMLQFALDFVQMPNIDYIIDEKSASIDFAKEYMRFPDEVLFDKEGDCDCKSSLMLALCLSLGYDVIFMISQKLGHAAIGIECKDEWLNLLNLSNVGNVVREYKGKSYIYCETTGDGFRIGNIKEGDSIHDFETIVELSFK